MLLALPGEAAAAPAPGPGPGPGPPPLLHALLTQPGALEELGACVAECCLGPVLPAVSQVCSSAALLSSCSSVHLLSTALTAALAGPLSSELFVDFGVRLALLPHKDAARGILFDEDSYFKARSLRSHAPVPSTASEAPLSVVGASPRSRAPGVSVWPAASNEQGATPHHLGTPSAHATQPAQAEVKLTPRGPLATAMDLLKLGSADRSMPPSWQPHAARSLPSASPTKALGGKAEAAHHPSAEGATKMPRSSTGMSPIGHSAGALPPDPRGRLLPGRGEPHDTASSAGALITQVVVGAGGATVGSRSYTPPAVARPQGKAVTFPLQSTLAGSLLARASAAAAATQGTGSAMWSSQGMGNAPGGLFDRTSGLEPSSPAPLAPAARTMVDPPAASPAGFCVCAAIVPSIAAYIQDAASASSDIATLLRRGGSNSVASTAGGGGSAPVACMVALACCWSAEAAGPPLMRLGTGLRSSAEGGRLGLEMADVAVDTTPPPAFVLYLTSPAPLPSALLAAAKAKAAALLEASTGFRLRPAAEDWAVLRAVAAGASASAGLTSASIVGGGGALPGHTDLSAMLSVASGMPSAAIILPDNTSLSSATALRGIGVGGGSNASHTAARGSWDPTSPSAAAGGPMPASAAAARSSAGASNAPLSPSLAGGAAAHWSVSGPMPPGSPHRMPQRMVDSALDSLLSTGIEAMLELYGSTAGGGTAGPSQRGGAPAARVAPVLTSTGRSATVGGMLASPLAAAADGGLARVATVGSVVLGGAGLHSMVSTVLSDERGEAAEVEATRQATMGLMVASIQSELHRTRTEAVPPGGLHAEDDVKALQLRKPIGSGGCSVVVLATLHAMPVAVKVIWPPDEADPTSERTSDPRGDCGNARPITPARQRQMRQLLQGVRELAVMTSISHPNIVQVYSYCTRVLVPDPPSSPGGVPRLVVLPEGDPAPGPLCTVLIMEYCDMGSLADAIDTGLFAKASKMAAVSLTREHRSATHLSSSPQAAALGHRSGPLGGMGPAPASASAGASGNRMLNLLWPAVSAAAAAGGPIMRAVYLTLLEVALALRHLHSTGLVHCDVKPANVLLRSSATDPRGFTAKLTDFGFVNLLELQTERDASLGEEQGGTPRAEGRPTLRFQDRLGTVTHMAPELFLEGSSLDSSIDVYAFGIVMWELYTGRAPYAEFSSDGFVDVPYKVVKEGMRPRFPGDTPQHFKVLAQSCWAARAEQRPTAAFIVNRLQMLLEACASGSGVPAAASATTAASAVVSGGGGSGTRGGGALATSQNR
ncbi:hypothetical protein HYH03_007635 [Edaphochlamys debaryana]|uniref:Protein kinase domain-containing protein n=1 Tax=Edaphochlamys debaryana TaxID=47281 RepID=A0A835Y097_9CHLO|nr:hypothetical protein HYH03_007635 [Edaphochlamys debaryana]|eukprot:KAG2494282.1 hypothetical protein HYH03_007635 [Edaphochlamys debaryana]